MEMFSTMITPRTTFIKDLFAKNQKNIVTYGDVSNYDNPKNNFYKRLS